MAIQKYAARFPSLPTQKSTLLYLVIRTISSSILLFCKVGLKHHIHEGYKRVERLRTRQYKTALFMYLSRSNILH